MKTLDINIIYYEQSGWSLEWSTDQWEITNRQNFPDRLALIAYIYKLTSDLNT